jgi:type I restriction enzyme S subunit
MVDPYYLALVFAETRVSDVLTFESVGSTMDNLNTEILGSCQFGLPPLSEQRGIVAHVAAETTKLDALRSATERTIALLKERRSALIAAAVTGKLDVQGVGRHIAIVAD